MLATSRVAAAFLLLSLLGLAQAQTRTINVAGTGSASAAPDLATVNVGVTTMAATAMEALDDNSKAFANVLEVLQEKGIAETDIQTTFFTVNPQFERRPRGEQGDLIGYRVRNEVQVKVRDIDMLGEILDALVTAGSNRISGITFSIADPKPLQDQAREAAVEDAMSRARLYARAAGVSLGQIIAISEQPISQPSPESAFSDVAARGGAVPISPGEVDISATVFILFAIA